MVDVRKIKVGDTVALRDGRTSVVEEICRHDGICRQYDNFVLTLTNYIPGRLLYCTADGRRSLHEQTAYDIVEHI